MHQRLNLYDETRHPLRLLRCRRVPQDPRRFFRELRDPLLIQPSHAVPLIELAPADQAYSNSCTQQARCGALLTVRQ